MEKNIIIGGAGYIGTVLIDYLLKKNKQVICVDSLIYKNKFSISSFKKKKNFKFIKADLRSSKIIKKLIDKDTNVIILAGLVGDPITKKYFKLANSVNKVGIDNLLNSISDLNFKKLLFVSTCSNYGLSKTNKLLDEKSKLNPISKYANDKVFIEKKILKLNKINFCPVILRFATAFGLSKRMRFDLTINEFVKEIYLNKSLEIYDFDTYRPYCHTVDFARAIDAVIKSDNKFVYKECFNVGNKKNNFQKKAIVDLILKKIKFKKNNIKFVNKSKDRRNYRVNFNKIEKKLKFKTKYSVNYGIKEILKYLNQTKLKNKNFYGNYKI